MSSRLVGFLLALASLQACATVPPHRYGVKRLEIEGMKRMDDESLRACLQTAERRRATVGLGVRSPGPCGEPPFDVKNPRLRLWSWPTSDWPLFDRLSFQRDLERILRWYSARGFHAARVVDTSTRPSAAMERDTLDAGEPNPGCTRRRSTQGCEVHVRVVIDEGPPTRVERVALIGAEQLPNALRRKLAGELQLAVGDRFDEALYESSKERLVTALQDRGYALARVVGEAKVDRARQSASVELRLQPGPLCTFGEVRVFGAEPFLVDSVRAITLIDRGDRFDLETLRSAQRAVFSTGNFLTVNVEPVLPQSGSVVDVEVAVASARKRRFGVGAGVQAGIVTRGDTWDPISVPQWDVHLIAKYVEQRFLSGARSLSLEERPALVIQEPFPGFTTPRFGNELRAELRQAGVFEPRISLQWTASHIWGPDPFDTFFRHRIDSALSLTRLFLRSERLLLSAGVRYSIYLVPEGELTKDGDPTPADSLLAGFFQRARLDFRDNEARPRRGFMWQTEVQQAGVTTISSWRYVRTTPDARFYVPLPFSATLALRFALGFYFIFSADKKLDELSRQLGPRDYRLRGGGATSNRGFLPGQLGDGSDGGTRRWESSLELRLPVTQALGVVGFMDAGDVSREQEMRWDHPQTSAGFGLRYHTIVGPLRLDFAWRIPGMQVFGPDLRDPGGTQNEVDFGFATLSGAIHLTIGESF